MSWKAPLGAAALALACAAALQGAAASADVASAARDDAAELAVRSRWARNDLAAIARLAERHHTRDGRWPAGDVATALGTADPPAPARDPWGSLYALIAAPSGSAFVASAGPDRVMGTADDLVREMAAPVPPAPPLMAQPPVPAATPPSGPEAPRPDAPPRAPLDAAPIAPAPEAPLPEAPLPAAPSVASAEPAAADQASVAAPAALTSGSSPSGDGPAAPPEAERSKKHVATRERLLALARKLGEYRRQHGHHPEGDDAARVLTELGVRDPPLDAWGRPLHYLSRATGAGYVLVSAGADGRLDRNLEAYSAGRTPGASAGADVVVRDGKAIE